MVTIDVFTMGYNEELILPHFIKYHKQFARKITFFNNCSTDKSKEICEQEGVKVIDTDLDQINEVAYLGIKENAYAESDADFVIVVDADEFVYHTDLVKLLKQYKKDGINLPKVRGYTMATTKGYPDINDGVITDHIKNGVISINYAKRCIFDPRLQVKWQVGCHNLQSVSGPVAIKESEQQDISILHYKFVDIDEILRKRKEYPTRISQLNRAYNLAFDYFTFDEQNVRDNFQGYVDNAIRLI